MQTPTTPQYTLYHPRWYRKPVSTWWWVGTWPYTKFILREISSISVAWVVLLVLMQMYALMSGPISYAAFNEWLASPLVLTINLIALAFVIFHTITWFIAAPTALAIRVGGRRVPNIAIAGPHYLGWIAISAFVYWIVVGR